MLCPLLVGYLGLLLSPLAGNLANAASLGAVYAVLGLPVAAWAGPGLARRAEAGACWRTLARGAWVGATAASGAILPLLLVNQPSRSVSFDVFLYLLLGSLAAFVGWWLGGLVGALFYVLYHPAARAAPPLLPATEQVSSNRPDDPPSAPLRSEPPASAS